MPTRYERTDNEGVVLVDPNDNVFGTADNPLNTKTTDATGSVDGTIVPTIDGTSVNTVLFDIDTSGYSTMTVQTLATAFSGLIIFQGMNPGGTWLSITGEFPTSAAITESNNLQGPNNALVFPLNFKRVRAILSTYTSGTAQLSVVLRKTPPKNREVRATLAPSTTVIGLTTLRSTGTARSATVGTSASVLMAANANRQGWRIKNDTTGDIWINFDTTATAVPGGGNIKIPAGAFLASEPGFVETGAISVIGSAAGLNITAREY